jgi:hypothetical protein
MKVTRTGCVLAIFVSMLMAAGSARAFQVIDSFDVPSNGQSVTDTTNDGTAVTGESGGLAISDVVGGVRYMEISKTAGGGNAGVILDVNEATTQGSFGELVLDNKTSTASSWKIVWDGNSNSSIDDPGTLNEDYSGFSEIRLGVSSSTVSGATIALTLEDTDDDQATVSKTHPTDSAEVNFPFAGFTNVDKDKISRIELAVTGITTVNQDAVYDFVRATPEPGMALLLGVVGLVALVRRPGRK